MGDITASAVFHILEDGTNHPTAQCGPECDAVGFLVGVTWRGGFRIARTFVNATLDCHAEPKLVVDGRRIPLPSSTEVFRAWLGRAEEVAGEVAADG